MSLRGCHGDQLVQLPAADKRGRRERLPSAPSAGGEERSGIIGRNIERSDRELKWAAKAMTLDGRLIGNPEPHGPDVALSPPFDDQLFLPLVRLVVVHRHEDQAVDVCCAELLENAVDVAGPKIVRRSHRLAGREVREEIPSQNLRFLPPAEGMQHVAQGNPFGLVRRIEPCDSMIEAGLDDPTLVMRRGGWVIAELLDERVPSENQGNLGYPTGCSAFAQGSTPRQAPLVSTRGVSARMFQRVVSQAT